MERKLEKAVERASSGVDGRNACWGKNDMFLLGIGGYLTYESRFTRPRLSGKEKRTTGKLYDLECILQLRVVEIHVHIE